MNLHASYIRKIIYAFNELFYAHNESLHIKINFISDLKKKTDKKIWYHVLLSVRPREKCIIKPTAKMTKKKKKQACLIVGEPRYLWRFCPFYIFNETIKWVSGYLQYDTFIGFEQIVKFQCITMMIFFLKKMFTNKNLKKRKLQLQKTLTLSNNHSNSLALNKKYLLKRLVHNSSIKFFLPLLIYLFFKLYCIWIWL